MHGPLRLPAPRTVHDRAPNAEPAGPGGAAEPGLRAVLQLLWRRKHVILATVVAGMLLAGLVVHALPERYRAATVLLFQPLAPPVAAEPGGGAVPGAADELGRLASEIEVMRSRGLLEAVVERAELLFEPEFNASLRPANGLLVRLGLAALPDPHELRLTRQRARTVAELRARMTAHVLGRSRVVEIAVESRDPVLAARVANAVAEVYLARSAASGRKEMQATADWLDTRVAQLRRRVQAADAAVADYRLASGLVERGADSLSDQRIAEVNRALVAAGQARSEAETRLRQLDSLAAAGGGASAAGVLESATIAALRGQEAELLRRRAELAIVYGPRHPGMAAVSAELLDLRREIASEVDKILQHLRNEAAVAREREAGLRRELAAAGREAGRARRAEVRLAQLQREAAAERALFETFLARLKATAISGTPPLPQAEVITAASPPLTPSSPNRPLLLALALMACGAGGVGLAFAAEALDRGVRDLPQLEAATGRPALALIPKARLARGQRLADVLRRRPQSGLAEAVRGLHTALLLADPERPLRSVMLTSALPGEGKTSLAAALACTAAAGGQRVLLLDADLRHPAVAGETGLPSGPGLVEVLAGQRGVAEAIRRSPGGPDVLTAGRVGDPAALLASPRLNALLQELGGRYDLVVVDAPPVLAVADPRALAPTVDRTVLVVRWARTPRETVTRAARLLHDAGGAVAGSVLTQVDLRRHAQDGGESGYARGYYAE